MATFNYRFNEELSTKILFLPDDFDLAEELRAYFDIEIAKPDATLEGAYNASLAYHKAKYGYVEGKFYPVRYQAKESLRNLTVRSSLAPYIKDTTCAEKLEGTLSSGYTGIKYNGFPVATYGHHGLQYEPVGQLSTAYCEDDSLYSLVGKSDSEFILTATMPDYIEPFSILELVNICDLAHEDAPFKTREFEVYFNWDVLTYLVPEYFNTYFKQDVWPPFGIPATYDMGGPDPLICHDGGPYLPFIVRLPDAVKPYATDRFKGRTYNPDNTVPWSYTKNGIKG